MQTTSIVLIGGDDRRHQLKRLLRQRRDLHISGEIGEAQALHLIERLPADIIVLDCAAYDINALTVLPWLKSLPNKARVIALGANGTATERRLLNELGAAAYATLETPQTLFDVLPASPAEATAITGMRVALRG
ncbi:MAG: response regulator transcription factor [Thermoflexales bacterium]|nr:response regulator transcription factor [Thermoflexales bacterium]